MGSETTSDRGGNWVLGQSVLLLILVIAGPVDRAPAPPWSFWTGLALFTLAAWLGIAGVARLGRNRTPFPRPRTDSRLITTGIYAWLRHPLYTCLLLASLGWAGLFHSRAALILTLPLGLFLIAKARREERWLREQFPEYEQYRRRVAAFVPGLW